ncbi:MAG: hypothetical protein ACI9F9_000931, partial [Candidatus Paceibacteria bacterium]
MRWIPLILASLLLTPQLLSQDSIQENAAQVEWGPWWVLLPLEHKSGVQKISKVYSPEKRVRAQRAGSPGPKLDEVYRGQGKQEIRWQKVRESTLDAPDFGPLNFVELVSKEDFANPQGASTNAVAYAYRTLTAKVSTSLDVNFGSDDSCRVWFNGELVFDLVAARGLDVGGDQLTLKLREGVNHLFVKVSNGGGAWGAQFKPRLIRFANKNLPGVSQDAINKAIDRGVIHLLQTQQLDGSWGFVSDGYRNGQTALAAYALLKCGLRPGHPAVRRAMAFLAVSPPRKTYGLVCHMLALHATKVPGHVEVIHEFGNELEDWENSGYAYPSGGPDLSNTQYGALGLWLLNKSGGTVSKRAWKRIVDFAFDCQNEDGGFGYRPGGTSTGSMTVAGLTTIQACELAYKDGGMPNGLKVEIADRQARGMAWLGDNFRVDKNPSGGGGGEKWKYYYLYGVERLAALMEFDLIAGVDWYKEGARFLVKAQAENGSWATAYGESEPNTAFALLCLSRSTATTTGSRTSNRHQRTYATDDPGAEVILRATKDSPLNLWVSDLDPIVAEKRSREGPGGEGLYLSHVEYLVDGEVIHTEQAESARPWSRDRFAYQHMFSSRGFHEVQVILHLAPDVDGKGGGTMASPKLKVRIDELLEPWMMEYPGDELGNLVLLEEVTAHASSERGGGNPAIHVTDGRMASGWLSAV